MEALRRFRKQIMGVLAISAQILIPSLVGSVAFVFNSPEGVGQSQEITISVTPNPTRGITSYSLEGNSGKTCIEVLDAEGNIIITKEERHNRGILDFENHSAGIYTLRVTDEYRMKTVRIVKQ